MKDYKYKYILKFSFETLKATKRGGIKGGSHKAECEIHSSDDLATLLAQPQLLVKIAMESIADNVDKLGTVVGLDLEELIEIKNLPDVGALTAMQQFFLDTLREEELECTATYLAVLYYESIGKRRHAASRDSFGQTSAAYRTCRALVSKGLIKERLYKTTSGYSYSMYQIR